MSDWSTIESPGNDGVDHLDFDDKLRQMHFANQNPEVEPEKITKALDDGTRDGAPRSASAGDGNCNRSSNTSLIQYSDISSEWKSSVARGTMDTDDNGPVPGILLTSSANRLYGRDKERQILSDCLRRVIQTPDKKIGSPSSTKTASKSAQQVQQDRSLINEETDSAHRIDDSKVFEKHPTRQLVLVTGHSGVGKSALAGTLMQETRDLDGAYVRGKFDQHLRDEPYVGISAACRELCGEILLLRDGESATKAGNLGRYVRSDNQHRRVQRKRPTFDEVRSALLEDLGTEISYLTRVVPHLEEIIDHSSLFPSPSTNQNDAEDTGEADAIMNDDGVALEARNRLHYAFRRFLRVATKYFKPLVVFFDDLQWADVESLELMEVLITDQGTENFLVVGSYRSNEVDSGAHVLAKVIRDWKQRQEHGEKFGITEISVGNLSVPDVKELILDILGIGGRNDNGNTIAAGGKGGRENSTSRAQALAQILHQKTNGNVFFVLQFLQSLYDQRLLIYKSNDREWVWDDTELQSKTFATENVVDIVKAKMIQLSADVRQLLRLASCLSSSFDEIQIARLWNDLGNEKQVSDATHSGSDVRITDIAPNEEFTSLLNVCKDEGLLLEVHSASNLSSGRYKWVHDRIQEAAFALIPQPEVRSYQRRVGDILATLLNEKHMDVGIFVAVNLLNDGYGIPKDLTQRIRLALLNLKAAQRAVSLSAFKSAETFAGKGVLLLPGDKWSSHRSLAVELYSIAAEAEGFMAHYEEMQEHCREVLAQDIEFLKKLRLHKVEMNAALRCDRIMEATDICLTALRKLRCKFPSNAIIKNILTIGGLLRIKATIRSRTPDEISQMQLMTDPGKIEAIVLLDHLASFCYMSANPLLPLVIFRSLHWTIKYGLCEHSPPAFATVAVILTGLLMDFQGGARYGLHALRLIERLRSKVSEGRTTFVVHALVLPWSKPCHTLLKPLLRAYEISMQRGDIESAMGAIFQYISLSFYSGRPLELVEVDCRIYAQQAQELKHPKLETYLNIIRQTILNLMGRSENTTTLTGNAMDYDEYCRLAGTGEDPNLSQFLDLHQNHLYAFFGEYRLCADQAIAMGDQLAKQMPASPFLLVDPLFRGLAAFSMARSTKKRKYVRLAKKAAATMKSWVGKGNPNSMHMQSFLDAELAVLKGKRHVATTNYDAAAGMALRAHFLPHAALAHQRHGEFLLNVASSSTVAGWPEEENRIREEASFHLKEAAKIFLEWGSQALANKIFEKHSSLWPQPNEILTSIGAPIEDDTSDV